MENILKEINAKIKELVQNLFKYKKTINFDKYNNGDETFFSRCEHHITKFIFRIHQTDEIFVSNDLPTLTTYFPKKGDYDITCKSEMEKDCTHPHKNISTYKIGVELTDMVIISIFIKIIDLFIYIVIIWLIVLGFNTLI